MASFVANHRKKRELLLKKEQELHRLIERGAEHEKLLVAALEVRDARIRVLRAKQNQNPESNAEERAIFLKDGEAIKDLLTLTPEAVLADYFSSCGA